MHNSLLYTSVVYNVHKKKGREQEQSGLRLLQHTTSSQTTAVRYRTFSFLFLFSSPLLVDIVYNNQKEDRDRTTERLSAHPHRFIHESQ
eukprot:766574-Hanusia_phi.AAC.6